MPKFIDPLRNDAVGRIVAHAPYGEHVELACVNHPELRWSTKNISPIGCRSVFYNLMHDAQMGMECDCPLSCLKPIAPEA